MRLELAITMSFNKNYNNDNNNINNGRINTWLTFPIKRLHAKIEMMHSVLIGFSFCNILVNNKFPIVNNIAHQLVDISLGIESHRRHHRESSSFF